MSSLSPPAPSGPLASIAAVIEARPLLTRWLLAGPLALVLAVATLAAMPLWLPAGRAGIDNIALPVLLTPLIWAVPFFYACLAENLPRAAMVMLSLTLAQGAAILVALS